MRLALTTVVSLIALSSVAWAETAPVAAPQPTAQHQSTPMDAPVDTRAIDALKALPPAGSPTIPTATGGAPTAVATFQNWMTAPVPADVGKIVDVKTIPALKNIVQAGTEARYLGDEGGLKAYFLVNAGQGEVIYITPDGLSSIAGTMFTNDGNAVSFLQVLRLRRTGFDPSPYLDGSAAQSLATSATGYSAPAQAAVGSGATVTTPAVSANPSSPGEQLVAEITNASFIGFGSNTAPLVNIFMDPNCDHCHKLFKELLPLAQANKLYLRIIPISLIYPDKSGTDVLNIFGSSNPAAAWTAKVNGQPLPTIVADSRTNLAAMGNNNLFTRWNLTQTPYSVYRAKSGEVKVLSGKPANMSEFLAELGVR